jgi:hypothetical protein
MQIGVPRCAGTVISPGRHRFPGTGRLNVANLEADAPQIEDWIVTPAQREVD